MKMNNVGGIRPKRHNKQPEYILQTQVCRYLRLQYRDVYFVSDALGSIKLTPAQAERNKKIQKNDFHPPDVLILEPKKGYSGLFIELKIITPYKLNGQIKTDKHLQDQERSIKKMNEKGYFACFSWNFEMTKNIIDKYLKE